MRISNRPLRSLTANAVVAPSAETIAPATGAPCSSSTMPWIDPAAIDATCVTGRSWPAPCAAASRRKTEEHQTADDRRRVILELAAHVRSRVVAAMAYDGLTVKLISRVSVLFAILSVTLISSR